MVLASNLISGAQYSTKCFILFLKKSLFHKKKHPYGIDLLFSNLLGTLLNDIITYHLQILSIWHPSAICDTARRFWSRLLKRGMWRCSQSKIANYRLPEVTLHKLKKMSKLIYIDYMKFFIFPVVLFSVNHHVNDNCFFIFIQMFVCRSVYGHRRNQRRFFLLH